MYIQEPLEEKRETLVMKLRRIHESIYEVVEFSLANSNRETVFSEDNTSDVPSIKIPTLSPGDRCTSKHPKPFNCKPHCTPNPLRKNYDSSPRFENETPTSAPEPSTYSTDTLERELTQQSEFSNNPNSSPRSEDESSFLTLHQSLDSLDSLVPEWSPQSQDSGINSISSPHLELITPLLTPEQSPSSAESGIGNDSSLQSYFDARGNDTSSGSDFTI
ncbi:hypothetical protein ACTXT7_014660 [Hymenolepis weldensis]